MSQLIPVTPPPSKSQAQATAEALIDAANAEFQHRVQNHQQQYRIFWNSPDSPDALLAAMGANAARFLAGSRKSVEDILGLIAIVEPDQALYAAKAEELFPMSTWYPRRELIEHPDGTVTLAPPAEGFDAWGRPISEPEPEA